MIKKLIYTCMILPIILLANNNLEISLEHNTSSKNPLEVILKVTNTSDKNIQITPADFAYDEGGIARDLFTVLEDGEKVAYIGPIVLMNSKQKTLAEGESYQGHVNLAEYYQLKVGTHNYEIHYGITDNNLSTPLEVEAIILPKKKTLRTRQRNCNNNQLSSLGDNIRNARNLALQTKNHLQNSPRSHALYQKWFGTETAGRYHTVYINYSRIYSGLHQNVQFDCAPTHPVCSSSIAYVFPNRPYQIHLCQSYWNQSSENKASILIHEISHFSNVAGTIDGDGILNGNGVPIHIGSGWAKYIAKNTPSKAIRNAYSYHNYVKEVPTSGGGSGGSGGGSASNINYEFNSAQGWTYENLRQHGNGPTGGVWYFQASYNDPQLISPALNINANVLKKVVIQMANDHNPYQYSRLQVYWRGTGQGYSEANSQTVSVTNHGGWSTYTIDMSSNPRWNGNIREIRIDPIYRGDGHWLAFDYIRFTR